MKTTTSKLYTENKEIWSMLLRAFNCATEKEVNKLISTGKEFELIFTIGGIELDIEKFIKSLYRDYDTLVKIKAQELINSKYGDMMFKLNELQEKTEKLIIGVDEY